MYVTLGNKCICKVCKEMYFFTDFFSSFYGFLMHQKEVRMDFKQAFLFSGSGLKQPPLFPQRLN